jgi:predicted TIM-barrel fold metal-dependent hydrolase
MQVVYFIFNFLERKSKKCIKSVIVNSKFSCFHFPKQHLSLDSQQLIDLAYANISQEKLVDYHVHLIGTNTPSTGNFIHPDFALWHHPMLHVISFGFEAAFGVENMENADQEALNHLIHLIDNMPMRGKFCLLAFDYYHNEKGIRDLSKSKLHVSNEYIYQVASERKDIFIPSMSIHPYREDAVEELEKWAQKGVKIIKWLPNVMGINPMDSRCIKYYHKMRDLDLILLTHVGDEWAVPFSSNQEFGNPLLYRYALDQNVKIIMAHCATLGKGDDRDYIGEKRSNFELFLRMMEDPNYQNILYGDISAVTQFNRVSHLASLIELSQPGELLFKRLVNGSDYPLPSMNLSISTKFLQMKGFLTNEEMKSLNEIYHWNPLVFDFVLKRIIKHPQTKKKFPVEIFMINESIRPLA